MTLINITLFIELGEYLSYSRLVIFVGGTYKIVIIGIHTVPHLADLTCDVINVFLGCDSLFSSEIFYFLTVLVSTRTEEYVVSSLLFISCDSIRHYNLVGITEVRLTRSICDRRCYIKFLFHVILL